MAESITLNNINIFQSQEQYLESKNSLSISDINLIPQAELENLSTINVFATAIITE